MSSFRISNLKVTEVLDGSSFVPATITQNSTFYSNGTQITEPTTVTRQLSIQNLRVWFDSGVYKQIRSGPSVKVTPENFTSTGTIAFHAPGFMALYAGSTDPNGWFVCDGRSLSTTIYPDLFSVIGYRYGGTGSSFNLPNLFGRSVFGVDNMGGATSGRVSDEGANILGSALGAREHILNKDQTPLVSHTHVTLGSFSVPTGPNRYGNNSALYTGKPRKDFNTSSGGCSHTLTLNISTSTPAASIPATSPHPNLPPFLVLNWIIKY